MTSPNAIEELAMKDATRIPPHVRNAIAAVAEVAPDLAGRIASFAMARTRRRPRRARDEALLASGERLDVRHGRHHIAAWVWGSGPTVHLVHGWNGRAAQLGAFVKPLVRAGMRVVAHDSIGHGASTGRSGSVMEMADGLARVVEATGPARALIAHSLGGTATAIALSRGLVTARATFLATPADTSRWPEQVFGLRGHAAARARMHAERRLGTSYARIKASALGRAVRIPVLVAHDRGDEAVPFEDALVLVRSIRDAGLIATSGLGHTGILQAEDVIEEVVRFTALGVGSGAEPAVPPELTSGVRLTGALADSPAA